MKTTVNKINFSDSPVQSTLFPPDLASDFPEFQDKTHPVPIGFESVLSDLQLGKVKSADAMLYIVANY